jgi:hypothetical protein
MHLLVRVVALVVLFSFQATAADRITKEQIMQLIDAADQAAQKKDARAIGDFLGSAFYHYVDVPAAEPPITVRVDKKHYLEFIENGWQEVEAYSYKRSDIVVNVASDGQSAESFSTILETLTKDGEEMVSKVREYATYMLEDGRPVIVRIEGHTLVGDTMPE